MDTDTRVDAIESAIRAEIDRDVGPLARHAADGLSTAAHSIAAPRHASVVILTGAYIPWATPPAAETDGPPGATLLAAGLAEFGIPVRLLTDHWCSSVLGAAGEESAPDVPIDVCDGEPVEVDRLLDRYIRLGVTHLVAVERLGPAADGAVRNFRGEDITPFTAKLDGLLSANQPWSTIGVGDGGNELGMGNIPSSDVASATEHGNRIHCVVPCDHLIVAGVSNWGALGLLLAVGLALGKRKTADAYVSAECHRRAVDACLAAGAVDGTLGRALASVDGLGLREHDAVIERIRAAGG
jgi:D-glutamate cyclase